MTAKCRVCGENLRDNARFCVGCGAAVPRRDDAPTVQPIPAPAPQPPMGHKAAPPPPRYPPPPAQPGTTTGRGLTQGTKTAVAVGTCALVVGAVVAISAGVGTAPSTPGGSGGSGAYAADTTPSRIEVTETIPAPVTTTTSTTPVDARTLLQQQADQDRSAVEQLVSSWVPQLSAKRPGTVANGRTYDYDSIWADFLDNRQRHPEALLLWSGDYSSFRYQDFWITVVPQQFGDGASANAWCDSYGISKDDCYAKRLMHTGGYAGNTLLRK